MSETVETLSQCPFHRAVDAWRAKCANDELARIESDNDGLRRELERIFGVEVHPEGGRCELDGMLFGWSYGVHLIQGCPKCNNQVRSKNLNNLAEIGRALTSAHDDRTVWLRHDCVTAMTPRICTDIEDELLTALGMYMDYLHGDMDHDNT